MRNFLLLLIGLSLIANVEAQDPVKVMSFNIRYDNINDGINAWSNRVSMIKSVLLYHKPDVLGIQESLPRQIEMMRYLLPAHEYYGVPRSKNSPEHCAIFFLRHKFELLDKNSYGTFWLSQTPGKESKGWDAALPRIASWVRLRSKLDSSEFLFVNTHFDHKGEKARFESSRLLVKVLDSLSKTSSGNIPVVLLGDFNALPQSNAIQFLLSRGNYQQAIETSIKEPHGPASTWSGWKYAGEQGKLIDHILVKGDVGVLSHGIITDQWNGLFPSDHLPVTAELIVNPVTYLPNAHAHNDYEHENPLFDALRQGFASVEADVWATDWKEQGGKKLIVNHDKPLKLGQASQKLDAQSLERLYLEPLAKICYENYGRVFPFNKDAFWLMIDVKGKDADFAYKVIMEKLYKYQWMLKGENPPVKIFLSGNRNLEQINADIRRWVSIDGRPEHLGKGYLPEQMPVISQRFAKVVNWNGKGEIPEKEFEKLKTLADQVHKEGKKLRLWGTVEDEKVWETLLRAGVDLINTDELVRLKEFFGKREKMNK
ncbi:MAG: endonuclease/exonuclease/phosphatase family protein [Bacteroidia bacterium]|nr:endonuclease/exonuclease/phosphatase family protein [Bacteroidia bacterium]